MLGPASLRSQQPLKSCLKNTYGNRGKRTSTAPTGDATTASNSTSTSTSTSTSANRQFNWDRLENERRARIEKAHAHREQQKLQQQQLEFEYTSSDFDALEAEAEAAAVDVDLLYSDPGPEHQGSYIRVPLGVEHQKQQQHVRERDVETPMRLLSTFDTISSVQGSDVDHNDRHSHKKSMLGSIESSTQVARTQESRGIMTVRSTQDSDSETYIDPPTKAKSERTTIRSSIQEYRSLPLQGPAIPAKSQSSSAVSLSSKSSRPAAASARKVMFQEEAVHHDEELFVEEDDYDDDANGDDDVGGVMFRTPSLHILQKLSEIPKLRVPEPRVNPFGFDSLPESGPGLDTGPGQLSDQPPSESLSRITTKRNSFFDSPTTKKSMDILNKRAQQLVDLQSRRKPKPPREPVAPTEVTNMEIEHVDVRKTVHRKPNHQTDTIEVRRRFLENGSSSDLTNAHEAGRSQSFTPIQNSRQTTPEPEISRHEAVQDDCVDLALGKRMSTIEITPRRLLAKQRKIASSSSDSSSLSSLSPLPSYLSTIGSEKIMNDVFIKPRKLFLDRDIPEDGQDDLDSLFMRARQIRQLPPLIPSLSALTSGSSFKTNINAKPSVLAPVRSHSEHRSSLSAPRRSQPLKFDRHSPSKQNRLYANSGSTTHLYDPFVDTMRNPFSDPFNDVPHQNGQEPTDVMQPITKLQSTSSRQAQYHSNHGSTPLPLRPLLQPPTESDQAFSVHAPLPLPPQQQRPDRKIRSLRRPASILVSSRKSVFRPTVDDLLSICDQRFFEQFLDLDSVNGSKSGCQEQQQQQRDPRGIVDFESLLPDSMVSSLTKIGEASYSEVYTVDLPVQQQRDRTRASSHSTKQLNHHHHRDDEFARFESSRLNMYVKESTEDDLLATQKDGDLNSTTSSTATTTNRTTPPRLVMKVMPFLDDQDRADVAAMKTVEPVALERGRRTKSGPKTDPSTLLALEDIYREAMVSTQIMHGWRGFIGSFGALVVRGKYPKTFLSVWDRFRKAQGTESERPDIYPKEQLYCIILLPYGGIDLEHCPLANWQQAWSVLTQVAASLESKEQAPFWFEHRDLHWGNILIKGTQQDRIVFSRRDDDHPHLQHGESLAPVRTPDSLPTGRGSLSDNDSRSIPTFGIIVQMIDFTLARVQGDKGNLIYMDLEKDQDLFRGQGDYQFEIYRKMRKHIGKNWSASCPRTNLFWLHYIADKLLTEKNLKKPKQIQSSSASDLLSSSSSSSTATRRISNKPLVSRETWCYERVLAVSKMNLDRLDPSGQTPSGTVLDLLLINQP